MKRTTKAVMSATLAIATIFSASLVFASCKAPKDPTPDPGIITPLASLYAYDNFHVFGDPAYLNNFNIPANYGWVKVWVKNNGQDTITVTVTEGEAWGPVKLQFTVNPGLSDFRIGSSPWSTGKHSISITPKYGSPVDANLSLKLAFEYDQLKYLAPLTLSFKLQKNPDV